jgi:hypothetical protein
MTDSQCSGCDVEAEGIGNDEHSGFIGYVAACAAAFAVSIAAAFAEDISIVFDHNLHSK